MSKMKLHSNFGKRTSVHAPYFVLRLWDCRCTKKGHVAAFVNFIPNCSKKGCIFRVQIFFLSTYFSSSSVFLSTLTHAAHSDAKRLRYHKCSRGLVIKVVRILRPKMEFRIYIHKIWRKVVLEENMSLNLGKDIRRYSTFTFFKNYRF